MSPTAHHLRQVLFSLIVVSFLFPAAVAQKKSDAKDDVILAAMHTELDRSKAQLKMEQVAAPYYIEYRVFDVDEYVADASFGALRGDLRTRFRFLRVVVRVGDYKQDSYIGRGEGTLDFMPVDDDMLAFRHQLWTATDRAYKAAAEALAAKQAQLKQLTIDQPVDDFARATPVQSIGPVVSLEFEAEPWKKMLQDASAVYKDDPALESFDSNLKFYAVNRYFVNSEGTVVRSGQRFYELNTAASAQAADGMSLYRSNGHAVTNLKQLPSAAEFVATAQGLAKSLKELREAPVAEEEYRGPVLFSADAASTIFSTTGWREHSRTQAGVGEKRAHHRGVHRELQKPRAARFSVRCFGSDSLDVRGRDAFGSL